MWLFQQFVKKPEKLLFHIIYAPQKVNILPTYCQVVNYLLATYTTDYVIFEAKADIKNFEQP